MEVVALDLLAIDTETTGVGWHDEAFMISVADGDTAKVWDKRIMTSKEWAIALDQVVQLINAADRIIMHNAKFDLQKLSRLGVPVELMLSKFEDTQCIAHLIDEHQPTGLKPLARKYLGETTDEDEVLKVWRRKNKMKKEDGYYPIPHEILAPYAIKDAEFTLQLYTTLYPRLHKDLYPLYDMEKELTSVLLRIEAQGMHVDRKYVTQKRKEYGDRIYRTKRRIGELAGEEFNPQSLSLIHI